MVGTSRRLIRWCGEYSIDVLEEETVTLFAFTAGAVNGVLLGGLYAITAVGLSLIFGVMRLVNIPHGEFLVLGAYLSFFIAQG